MLNKVSITGTKESLGLLISRVGFSFAMMYGHGWGKVMRLGEDEIRFSDPIGLGPFPSLLLAAFAEFVCSILVALGLYTRLALIPLIITMFVATFIAHAGDSFRDMEKSLLYLLYYISLFATGPGKFSMDGKFFKAR